jgi:hypothetical protein
MNGLSSGFIFLVFNFPVLKSSCHKGFCQPSSTKFESVAPRIPINATKQVDPESAKAGGLQ